MELDARSGVSLHTDGKRAILKLRKGPHSESHVPGNSALSLNPLVYNIPNFPTAATVAAIAAAVAIGTGGTGGSPFYQFIYAGAIALGETGAQAQATATAILTPFQTAFAAFSTQDNQIANPLKS